ncbi:isoprenylcysteine carboxylmethyltransferase family protein [Phanerochaete sordida]|uniref:Protein-S-isoprenylcysteine O-methyltransferase n=1 Tax=Phanerochaete sordida TaxID=48140 RepID=A0A9P3LI29_9APHY|nr:isoprenylcysteine carboxylmethyltransferase family protein [Phanerochaete sordida]
MSLLFATGLAFYYGVKSPNPPPERHQRITYRGATYFENSGYYVPLYIRVFAIVVTVSHATVVLLSTYTSPNVSDRIVPLLCPNGELSLAILSAFTPRFALSTAGVLAGGLGRVWCYRALRQFFTFEIALKDDHKLVTNGPYAYVRHPSYTAMWLLLGSGFALWTAPGGYLRECGIVDTRWDWFLHAWTAAALWGMIGLFMRAAVEDEMLRQRFGQVWEDYRRRVPWRFVPYLL